MDLFQTLVLSITQGLTELFPISSLGHTIIIAQLFNWKSLLSDESFLSFIVALHLGTTIALLIYFKNDWLLIIKGFGSSIKRGEIKKNKDEWLSWLLIVSCIPTGLIGVVLEHPIKNLFKSSFFASIFLTINGVILLIGEIIRRKKIHHQNKDISELTFKNAFFIGIVQCLAFLPGISRSGITMVGGLLSGLTHEDSAHYSFLLSAPIIGAAAFLEIPMLFKSSSNVIIILLGMVLSGVLAFLTTKFLTKYFKFGNLIPFALYCFSVGIITLIFWS